MTPPPPKLHGICYPAFERAFDCKREGTQNWRQRVAGIEPADVSGQELTLSQDKREKEAKVKASFLRYVQKSPGAALSRAVRGTHHHYFDHGTARAVIGLWLDAGEVPGVRIERNGQNARVYPTESA